MLRNYSSRTRCCPNNHIFVGVVETLGWQRHTSSSSCWSSGSFSWPSSWQKFISPCSKVSKWRPPGTHDDYLSKPSSLTSGFRHSVSFLTFSCRSKELQSRNRESTWFVGSKPGPEWWTPRGEGDIFENKIMCQQRKHLEFLVIKRRVVTRKMLIPHNFNRSVWRDGVNLDHQ